MINYNFSIIRNKGRVQSSNVKGYKYDTENKTLIITFNDNSEYLYEFIEFEEFEAISKGDAICTTEGSNKFGSWFVGKTPSVGAAIWRWLIRKGAWYTKLSQQNNKDFMLKKIDYDKLPVFELMVDESDDTGIRLVSIVENPAIGVKGYAFSDNTYYAFQEVEDEQIIVGPALIPGQKIYQEDDKLGPHFVIFSKEGIRKMVEKFNKSGSNRRINVEHTNQMVNAYILEDWIVEDEVYDKSRKYNFEVPVGTYMMSVKVEDIDFWKEKVKGESKFSFSIEGMLKQRLFKMSREFTIDDLDESDLIELLDFIELAEEEAMVTCSSCGWKWKISIGGEDPYTCHKCGKDNETELAVDLLPKKHKKRVD